MDLVPPHNEEAEACLLGSILLDNDVLAQVAPLVEEGSFYRGAHRSVYGAITSLFQSGQAVDLVLLAEELERQGQLQAIGGPDFLATLLERVPSPANAEYYARIVRDKAILRQLINSAGEIQRLSFSPSEEAQAILDRAEAMIFDIHQNRLSGHAKPIKELLVETFQRLDRRSESPLTGLPTGYYHLDGLTSGFQPSQLIILAGRPSMGKSSLALNIADHVAVQRQKPVAIYTLEMSADSVAQNILCAHAQVDAHRMRSGTVSETDCERLTGAMDKLSLAPILVDDSPDTSILTLRGKARRLKSQHDIQLLIVDYLQLLSSPGAESRQQEISSISRTLKSIARELRIPVLAVAQLSREVEKREGHVPRLSDLRESGSIEQDADLVMMLYRESYYREEQDQPSDVDLAQLRLAKHRNGPTGTIRLVFRRRFMRFENHTEEEQHP